MVAFQIRCTEFLDNPKSPTKHSNFVYMILRHDQGSTYLLLLEISISTSINAAISRPIVMAICYRPDIHSIRINFSDLECCLGDPSRKRGLTIYKLIAPIFTPLTKQYRGYVVVG